ncbi:hypothetical protein SMALB_5030 [Streptomyces malaysiensis]|uniref:Uncharacterized protein n=1 Tax=Streptomyces malaysiensis TaxID=92644 RepID=A0A7X5X5N6_STRMQ|nr:hypothetical protein [Streptomyces malaysiensis]
MIRFLIAARAVVPALHEGRLGPAEVGDRCARRACTTCGAGLLDRCGCRGSRGRTSGRCPARGRVRGTGGCRPSAQVRADPIMATETKTETTARQGPRPRSGRGPRSRCSATAEDTRFELVRGCPQHAFQVCWCLAGLGIGPFTCVHARPVV